MMALQQPATPLHHDDDGAFSHRPKLGRSSRSPFRLATARSLRSPQRAFRASLRPHCHWIRRRVKLSTGPCHCHFHSQATQAFSCATYSQRRSRSPSSRPLRCCRSVQPTHCRHSVWSRHAAQQGTTWLRLQTLDLSSAPFASGAALDLSPQWLSFHSLTRISPARQRQATPQRTPPTVQAVVQTATPPLLASRSASLKFASTRRIFRSSRHGRRPRSQLDSACRSTPPLVPTPAAACSLGCCIAQPSSSIGTRPCWTGATLMSATVRRLLLMPHGPSGNAYMWSLTSPAVQTYTHSCASATTALVSTRRASRVSSQCS